jgi:hypothetical protein
MKTIHAITALQALNAIDGKALPLRFAFDAARNRRLLADLEAPYEAKRRELIDRYGKKDAAGVLVVTGGNAQIEDHQAFNEAFQSLCDEDVPLTLHQVDLKDFPPDMHLGVMEALITVGMVREEK